MGQLHDKDVWHVITDPYKSNKDHISVLGRKPAGATIVRGPESAYKTARVLYGKRPNKEIFIDLGVMDIRLSPISGKKGVKISFKADPKIKTTGDISLTKKSGKLDRNGKVFPLPKGRRATE